MQKIKIRKKNNLVGYFPYYASDNPLSGLAMFLMQLRPQLDKDLSWILNPEFREYWFQEAGICLDSNDNDQSYIIITEYFDDLIPRYHIKREMLYKLAQAWLKILVQWPEMIDFIEEDDNKYIFEFDTLEGHQKVIVE